MAKSRQGMFFCVKDPESKIVIESDETKRDMEEVYGETVK